jgi:hypothetical protein
LFTQPPASPVEGFELDNGLLLSKKDKYYGLTLPFQTPLTMGDSPSIVIQYEIKFEEVLACGGAYVKLLRDITDFGDVNKDTPYSILFGPDKVTHSLTHPLTHSLTYLLTYSLIPNSISVYQIKVKFILLCNIKIQSIKFGKKSI